MIIENPIILNPSIPLTSHKWNILRDLWSQTKHPSLTFTFEDTGWFITEQIEGKQVFRLRRDPISLNRYTDTDVYGLLGLSLINLNDTTVYLTEGVSDYISAKLCLPNHNILGVTQLGGSIVAKKIIISLFDKVNLITDADVAGSAAAYRWKALLNSQQIQSTIWQPSSPSFKDFTDEFLFNLKLGSPIQF